MDFGPRLLLSSRYKAGMSTRQSPMTKPSPSRSSPRCLKRTIESNFEPCCLRGERGPVWDHLPRSGHMYAASRTRRRFSIESCGKGAGRQAPSGRKKARSDRDAGRLSIYEGRLEATQADCQLHAACRRGRADAAAGERRRLAAEGLSRHAQKKLPNCPHDRL